MDTVHQRKVGPTVHATLKPRYAVAVAAIGTIALAACGDDSAAPRPRQPARARLPPHLQQPQRAATATTAAASSGGAATTAAAASGRRDRCGCRQRHARPADPRELGGDDHLPLRARRNGDDECRARRASRPTGRLLLPTARRSQGDGVDACEARRRPAGRWHQQVTYNGHLLYTFISDVAPGDAKGQGLGDVWYVVTPAGERWVEPGPADPYQPT